MLFCSCPDVVLVVTSACHITSAPCWSCMLKTVHLFLPHPQRCTHLLWQVQVQEVQVVQPIAVSPPPMQYYEPPRASSPPPKKKEQPQARAPPPPPPEDRIIEVSASKYSPRHCTLLMRIGATCNVCIYVFLCVCVCVFVCVCMCVCVCKRPQDSHTSRVEFQANQVQGPFSQKLGAD
jgi:hypothetical protein